MEKKDNKKTLAIVGTIAAILLCGCPGLGICVSGLVTVFGGMPDVINGYGNMPSGWGYAFLCAAIIMIAIGVVVPILLLKKKKEPKVEDILPGEPLPPVS